MKMIVILALGLFCSCNFGVQSPPVVIPNMYKQADQQPVVLETQPYFNGHAIDGSWELSLEAKSDGTFPLKLNLNGGSVILTGNLQKEGLMKGSKPNVTTGEVKFSGTVTHGDKTEVITISVTNQPCSDKAGHSHTHSIAFQHEGKAMKGCGDYAAE